MNPFEPPTAFVRLSMSITAVVAASWWVNYELAPVIPSATSFLPIYLLMMTARVILGLAICGAGGGIGVGSAALSITCFRYLNRERSPQPWVRSSSTLLSIIIAVIVFFGTYGIGLVCIGVTSLFAECVMFMGLQVSVFITHRCILRWRQAKVEGPIVNDA